MSKRSNISSSGNCRKKSNFFIRHKRKKKLLELFRISAKHSAERSDRKTPAAIARRFAIWLAVLLCIALFFIDHLLYFAVTSLGSRILGADITMDELTVSLTRGDIKIINLRISDPDSHSQTLLMEVASAYAAIEPLTVFQKNIIIRQLELCDIKIHTEISEHGQFALKKTAAALADTEQKNSERHFIFEHIRLDRLALRITDQRKENNINGASLFLNNAEISTANGYVELNLLTIDPPTGYQGPLLTVNRAAVQFTPDMFYSASPVIENLEIDGAQAVAGLQDKQRSSIQEIIRSCNMIFFPNAENDNDEDTAFLKMNKFAIKNISFSFADDKKESPIHGFGVNFKELSGSLSSGTIRLADLQVTNPHGFSRNMLQIKSAALDFIPDTIGKNHYEISLLEAENIQAVVGFREDNRSNLYAIYRSLENFFIPFASDNNEPYPDRDTFPVVGKFRLSNVALSVWDARSSNNISGFGISLKELSGSGKNGTLDLESLRVMPPAGYHYEDMLSLKTLSVKFDPAALTENRLIIKDITADDFYAVAGLKDHDQSNIGEIINSVELLLSPLATASCTDDVSQKVKSALEVKNYRLRNFRFALKDSRTTENVNGLNMFFKELAFDEKSQRLHLSDLRIANPAVYRHKTLLRIDDFSAELAIQHNEYFMNTMEINGLHCLVEFRSNGKCNLHESADAICLLFNEKPFCKRHDTVSPPAESKTFIRKYYKLADSSLMIWEENKGIPLTIPLAQEMNNMTTISDGTPLLQSFHQTAVYLEQSCAGKTDMRNNLKKGFDTLIDYIPSHFRGKKQL